MKNLATEVARGADIDPYAQFADAMAADRRVTSGDYSGVSRVARELGRLSQRRQHGELSPRLNSPQVECLREKAANVALKPPVPLGIYTDPYDETKLLRGKICIEIVRVQHGRLFARADWPDAKTDKNAKSPLNEFLRPVIRLENIGHVDAALDVLYDRIEDLLKAKQFLALDELFQQAIADSMSVDIILGLLTATLPARKRLPTRSRFFATAESSIKTRGEWEEGLLTGLE